MPDVFVNYRTGDGDKTARAIAIYLRGRFGHDRIFLASTSIPLGRQFDETLLANARRCAVLLAVVGPDWVDAPALKDPSDWVRKEILESYQNQNQVIAVLDGRKTDRLRPSDLPKVLRWFATSQSHRLDEHNFERDLRTLADELCRLVPHLCSDDDGGPEPDPESGPGPTIGDAKAAVLFGSSVGGDAGTVVKGNSAPVHVGNGSQVHNAPHFAGGIVNYVAGSHRGDMNQRPEAPRGRSEDE
ncbi:TIR domain-containing protein [Frankia sp. AgKG'84/4]|uniref:TIR domain-containing protein n=1 Tax=Frankia sp. AgKG'84/4 TaxID=573490 RepID=UPI00200BE632|nr:TIR domain-containing protein [Frankia sp. AgKG'84/4]MCL9796085.1 TIR domain-containing protein [Frankia sp. AgKG'84/4]